MRITPASQSKVRRLFLFIASGCILFVVLTIIAMLAYPGGTTRDHSTQGYSFTHNFLSELGFITANSSQANWVSAILFFVALSMAGVSLVIFFVLFPRFFQNAGWQNGLCLSGSTVGVLAGISFVGVAFTPADVLRAPHIQFVTWAFRLFPLAVLIYLPAMFGEKNYPRGYAWVFTLFCLLLIGYYLLMTYGPRASTPDGLVIQVVGQKIIAYASILSIGIQSIGAYRFLGSKT